MPIFEYKCLKCGHFFEKLVRSSSEKVDCPGCSSKSVEKQLSVFGAIMGKSSSPGCAMESACPSAGTKCCSGGTCGLHR